MLTPAQKPRGLARMIFTETILLSRQTAVNSISIISGWGVFEQAGCGGGVVRWWGAGWHQRALRARRGLPLFTVHAHWYRPRPHHHTTPPPLNLIPHKLARQLAVEEVYPLDGFQ